VLDTAAFISVKNQLHIDLQVNMLALSQHRAPGASVRERETLDSLGRNGLCNYHAIGPTGEVGVREQLKADAREKLSHAVTEF
jgi:hypothetical protein